MDVPLQAPPQLANRASLAGDAVSVTAVPLATMTSQVDDDAPQSRPPPVTVPGPLTEADNRTCAGGGGCETKLADTAPSYGWRLVPKEKLPYIYIEYPAGHPAYPQGSRVPWLASQTDMLAEDWEVVTGVF